MNTLSTHVLDTSCGRPAAGVAVTLARETGPDAWEALAAAHTDYDGRIREAWPRELGPGVYRLRFETGPYFEARGLPSFYPYADVVFRLAEASGHAHVPLLLAPYGFSTYRGS